MGGPAYHDRMIRCHKDEAAGVDLMDALLGQVVCVEGEEQV